MAPNTIMVGLSHTTPLLGKSETGRTQTNFRKSTYAMDYTDPRSLQPANRITKYVDCQMNKQGTLLYVCLQIAKFIRKLEFKGAVNIIFYATDNSKGVEHLINDKDAIPITESFKVLNSPREMSLKNNFMDCYRIKIRREMREFSYPIKWSHKPVWIDIDTTNIQPLIKHCRDNPHPVNTRKEIFDESSIPI